MSHLMNVTSKQISYVQILISWFTIKNFSSPEKVVFTINDPFPSGIRFGKNSYMALTGAFNCNPNSDVEHQSINFIINNKTVNVAEAPNSAMCWRPDCHTLVNTTLSNTLLARVYNKEKENALSISFQGSSQSNYACLGSLIFELHVDVPNITVSDISPVAGPETGGTLITVTASKNIPKGSSLSCLFDRTSSPIILLDNGTIQCLSPPGRLGVVPFYIGLSMLNTTYLSKAGPIFEFYYSSILSHVVPDHGSMRGGTKVNLYGNLRKTGNYICRFTNGTSRDLKGGTNNILIVDVPGEYDDGKNSIACVTPQWPKHGVVYLSVSLNGQQFSKVITFKYDTNYFSLDLMYLVYAIVALASVVVVLVIIVVFVNLLSCKKLSGIHPSMNGDYKIINGDAEARNVIDEILFQECIGRGRFSEVHKAVWRGSVVAVKKFTPRLKIDDKLIRAFEKEVCTMRSLRSPNVIQFLGSFYSPPNVGIITEYMANGSLFAVLHNPEIALPWHVVLRMLSDAARGMHYLHTCKPTVLHRDLKSLNLLVDEFLRVKVCDFGLSVVCSEESDRKQGSLSKITECAQCEFGTLCWTAPEVLEGSSFTTKSDVYSFGIILWECATRCEPYNGIPSFKVIYSVCTENERPSIPADLPVQYTKLMTTCWDQSPDVRPEFNVILEELGKMESLGWEGQPTTTIDGKIPAKVESFAPVNNLSLLTSDAGIFSGFSSSSSSSFSHISSAILISPKI